MKGSTIAKGAAAAGIAYGITKAVDHQTEKIREINPIIPDSLKGRLGVKLKELYEHQVSNLTSVFWAGIGYGLWVWINFRAFRSLTGSIDTIEPGHRGGVWTAFLFMMMWPNIIAITCWAWARYYRKRRMENTIYAYVAMRGEQLEYIEEEAMKQVPKVPAEIMKAWNEKLEEHKKKVNPFFDDKYFPDFNNLSFEDKQVVYDSFTEPNKQNLRNYWVWLTMKPEEEQNAILDQIKQNINQRKVEKFDEIAFKKKYGRR